MATETKLSGLTAAEQATLRKLMDKANAANTHGPAVRIGEPYVALINLSVPRREERLDSKDTPQTDLVMAGDVVYLTDEEAARFNRHDPGRDGRRIPVVRKLHGPESSSEPVGKIHPAYMSGPVFRPPAPQPGQPADIPRPDPPGSSRIIEHNPVPEASPAAPGSENSLVDALDIPMPGTTAAQEVRGRVDQDIVSAAKAAMGTKKG